MDRYEIYRAQADMVLEFMESKGIKKDVLDIIVGPPAWSASSIPKIAQAEHKAMVCKLYADGMKQVQIARMTGRSQSGIAMLLQRARDKGEIPRRSYDARHAIQLEDN